MSEEFRLWSKDFVLICLANFFYFGSFYFLIPTLPQYVDMIGGSPGQVGLVMGLFTLASVIVRPYLGNMADRHGRKILMLLGSGFFILFPVIYNQVQSFVPLYLARIAHGLAHASFLAASIAYVADMAPPQRRGEVMGVYATSNVVAMALFPALGTAVIEDTGSFPYLFTLSALTAAAGFLAVALLGEIRSQAGRDIKQAGIWEVGRRREVLIPSLALFSGATSYGAVITFLPLFAPQRGLADFGLFFTVYAVSTILSRVMVGKLSDRIGRRKVILPFMAVLALAVFLFPFLGSLWLLALIGVLFGLGFGAFMPALNALVVDYTSPSDRGSALGFFTAFMDVGITTGAMILGLVGGRLGYPAMFNLGGAIILAGIFVFAVYMKPAERSASR
ncbi:major facilitator family transporter [Desulfocucumis palustris]|uniref:Major facilitator family transporter n=1 Tax=Desulfocucumis palustris TaxID=1898651 RepID=A0A2L2XF54_9FIRM|nr:MFS transporter [Desulfocucumis palustris]GBF34762.1 major facilitator family transporter [Desulfocucumis palustris]